MYMEEDQDRDVNNRLFDYTTIYTKKINIAMSFILS